MSATVEPTLAPPGAGLPKVELLLARLFFAAKRRWTARETLMAQFERERQAIRGLVAGCAPARRSRRVLIPRLRGLEDSSRYWSVWMVLDHLRITNRAFGGAISSLARGIVPRQKAGPAAVKPDPEVTEAVEADFEDSCETFAAAAAAVSDLRTRTRYAHPWFGEMDAAGWHALAAIHMRLHRRQIEGILGRL